MWIWNKHSTTKDHLSSSNWTQRECSTNSPILTGKRIWFKTSIWFNPLDPCICFNPGQLGSQKNWKKIKNPSLINMPFHLYEQTPKDTLQKSWCTPQARKSISYARLMHSMHQDEGIRDFCTRKACKKFFANGLLSQITISLFTPFHCGRRWAPVAPMD